MHHCPSNCHTHPLQTFQGVAGGSFTAPDHEYPAHLELQLTARDSGGLTDTESIRLDRVPSRSPSATNPGGLSLVVGGTYAASTFTRTVIQGSTNTISAPSAQTKAKKTWLFRSWSDGGAPTHSITTGSPTTYSATFRQR